MRICKNNLVDLYVTSDRLDMNKELRMIVGAGAAILSASSCSQNERPNVILIVADDIGYGDLSCYGATEVSTPNVDSLADAGIRFTNAHTCASTSTPSRYSLLTGMYPFRREGTDIAAGNAGMIIRPEQYTLADVFQSAGYKTAAIGKWHLGLGDKTGSQDWNSSLDMSPADIGFDYHYIMAATGDRVPCVFIEDGSVADWDKEAPIEVDYQTPFEGEPLGKTHPELLTNLVHSHGHNMAIVNGIGRIGYMKGGGKALWKDENIADSIAFHAVEFIEKNKDNPFFMYLCTNDIHVPRFPHERFRGKSGMGYRGDAVLQFDWTVGQIVAALEEHGLDGNTMIIITSDNGPVLDDGYQDMARELIGTHDPGGSLRGGKYSSFEAGNTVPFIVRLPESADVRGVVSNSLVSQIDFVASMAALVGTDVPEGMAPDSENHIDTWCGKDDAGRDNVVVMSLNRGLTVRNAEWKYIDPCKGPAIIPWGPEIETGYSSEPQLYNLIEDPCEKSDVADKHPDVLKAMKDQLEQIKAR